MTALLTSAFLLGLLGSLHCLGMCGPLAVALPGKSENRAIYALGRVLYNGGRILTYGLLGAIAGALGQSISMLGAQRGLSIGIGVVLLIGLALGPKRLSTLGSHGPLGRLMQSVKAGLALRLKDPRLGTLFGIGLLNGLLPCGLVYVAMGGAAATGSITQGIFYMLLFGLGTFPLMLAASLAGHLVIHRFRGVMRKAIPVGLAAVALLLIWRGFMSPEHCHSSPDAPAAPACCEHG